MNKFLYVVGAVLFMALALSNKSPNPITEDDGILPSIKQTSFKPGEKLHYKLSYGVVDAGVGTISLKSTDKDVFGRPLIHAVGIGRTLTVFDWFFKVRDRYETYIDKDGIFPWMFVRRVDEGGYIINQDYTFLQHRKKVNNGEGEYFKVPTGTQDMLSAFYYARSLDFSNAKKGDIFTITTFVDDELWDLKIKYKGKQYVKTSAGKFRCRKFVPIIQEGRIFKEEEDLNVWITDDNNKIPVLAKAKVLVGNIRMELTGYKGLANPVAKVKGS